ncbi:MAG: mechanosensitive ion channel family protein, partial [Clostridia bacterium]|nr:mechanosensitive ion channel family protein [Clostridia bacterium]
STLLIVFGIVGWLIGFAIMGIFALIIRKFKKGDYIDTHCPYCGATYEGCDYGYNEISRKPTNNGKVSSNFTYEIACNECGKIKHGKTSYSTESSDKNVQKLTKELDKIVGPEVKFDKNVAGVSKKENIINWAVTMGYCLLMIVLCIVFATVNISAVKPNKADTKDYYGKYVYGTSSAEFKSDGTVMFTNVGSINGKYEYKYYTEKEVSKKFSGKPALPALVVHEGYDSYMVFSLEKEDDHYVLINGGQRMYPETLVDDSADPKDYYGEYSYEQYSTKYYIKVTSDGKITYGTSSYNEKTYTYEYYTAEGATAKTGHTFYSPALLCFTSDTSYMDFVLSKNSYGEYQIVYDNKTFKLSNAYTPSNPSTGNQSDAFVGSYVLYSMKYNGTTVTAGSNSSLSENYITLEAYSNGAFVLYEDSEVMFRGTWEKKGSTYWLEIKDESIEVERLSNNRICISFEEYGQDLAVTLRKK